MPEFIRNFITLIEQTPADKLGNLAFIWVTPFIIFAICVWGFLELWLDYRQGKFASELKWITMHVNVPKDAIQTPKGIENFFTALSGAKGGVSFKDKWFKGKVQPWFSFELISEGGRIGYYIRTQEKYRDYIEAAFYAQYPEAQFAVVDDYAEHVPTDFPNDDYDLWGSELTIKKDEFLPIRTWDTFEHQGEKDARFKDPLLNMLEALGTMREGEHFYIQLLLEPPDDQDWTKKGQKYIEKIFGKPEPAKKKGMINETFGWLPAGLLEQSVGLSLGGATDEKKQDDFKALKITPFEKDVLDAVNRKISKVGWLAKIRFIYWGKKELMRKATVAPMAKGLFAQYTHQSLNSLGFAPKSTPQDDYPWQEWGVPRIQRALASRYKSRSVGQGMTAKIMNVEELATIWHFPAADARTPVLTTVGAKQAEAPVELGFALPTDPILQNMDRSPEDGLVKTSALPERKPLAVPGIRTAYGEDASQEMTNEGNARDNMISVPLQNEAILPQHSAIPAVPRVAVSIDSIAPDRVSDARQKEVISSEDTSLNSPSPTLPIMSPQEQAYMPKAGMPAPLPPGLDLSDQPVPPDYYDTQK